MNEIVTSPNNQSVKIASSLKIKKFRDELGLFIVEGVRLAEEALESDWLLDTCFYTPAAADSVRIKAVIAGLQKKNCRIIQVSDSVLAKIADTEQPQGIVLTVRKNTYRMDDLLRENAPSFLVILDGIQEPGNVGAIIRTADAAGCTGVILTKGCTDIYAAKTVRASMGSIFHLPIVDGLDRFDIISAVRKADVALLAAALGSAVPYFATDFTGRLAIVFGNEGQGVTSDFLVHSGVRLIIPIYGKAESLNVAAAAAVILYEAAKQRHHML